MKTVRMSRVLAGMVGAASLFLAVPASLAGYPGMGWDVFYTGEGESISRSYQRTPSTGTEGQGFDVFRSGDGVKLEDFQKAYVGTSMGSEASAGWDVFRAGEGDPLP
jgi:hypothetical protein